MSRISNLFADPSGEVLRRRQAFGRRVFLAAVGVFTVVAAAPTDAFLVAHGHPAAAAGILSLDVALWSAAVKFGSAPWSTPLLRRLGFVWLGAFSLGMLLPSAALQASLLGASAAEAAAILDGIGLGAATVGLALAVALSREAGSRVEARPGGAGRA